MYLVQTTLEEEWFEEKWVLANLLQKRPKKWCYLVFLLWKKKIM